CGASVAPQLMGIIVDNISVSSFAANLSQTAGLSPEEIGLRVGMLIAALFPVMGMAVTLYIRLFYAKKKAA
ncbi:MAG: hypothetical protein IJW62_06445, partial [Clostridia bacterium]|nr:hypothetical protein [Clostridia bacterium]